MSFPMRRSIAAAALAVLVGAGLAGCGRTTAPEADPQRETPPAAEESILTVEEYPIVEDSVDKPTHFEFMDRVDPAIRQKRQAIRESGTGPDVDGMNAKLAPFGYALRTQGGVGEADSTLKIYDLYKGEELILADITPDQLTPVFVNASETDWFFIAYIKNEGTVMVRSGEVLPWDLFQHLYEAPAYLGDDLLWVELAGEVGARSFRVVKEGEQLYEGRLPESPVDNPFKNLAAWDGHWAAEVLGDVILDGQSLSKTQGYSEVFDLRLIKGRPFYFYSKGGKVYMSYDGKTLPETYDEVIHYKCCEPAAFNPSGNDSMVWFWARKGSMWHYVEAGIYE